MLGNSDGARRCDTRSFGVKLPNLTRVQYRTTPKERTRRMDWESQDTAVVPTSTDIAYPRPQFVRSTWMSLNGIWEFAFDDHEVGEAKGWAQGVDFPLQIMVPFVFESPLSRVNDQAFHDVVWYKRAFEVPKAWQHLRLVLHFGAVDYACGIWINGQRVGRHEGGHVSFDFDITPVIHFDGPNTVVVRVEDRHQDLGQPRGKQYWKATSESIFYTRTTGIWQTVWLEGVAPISLERVQVTPDLDRRILTLEPRLCGPALAPDAGLWLDVSMLSDGQSVGHRRFSLDLANGHPKPLTWEFKDDQELRPWSPEDPYLYTLEYRLGQGEVTLDEVQSYVGWRTLSVEQGQFCLNGSPYYLKMVLDQGYFPDGILTAPDPSSLKKDVELIKQMGFNGVRKHQKIEDPRWLTWCDRLGLLVWEEMPASYIFHSEAIHRITQEWTEVVERDYNHPSIMAWVPINESWGIPNPFEDPRQPAHLAALYHLTKSLDPTRLVISNDGWEHASSDLITLHDYEGDGPTLVRRYQSLDAILPANPSGRSLFVPGFTYQAQPILVTEMGGISYPVGSQAGWGYTEAVSEDDFLARFRAVVEAIGSSPVLAGFCYTQFTDVEQEINGLLTAERQPKVALTIIRSLIEHTGQNSKTISKHPSSSN